MAHETKTLDALADGQFQPKLGDPGDTLTKRGGKGAVVFEGREYSRLGWITRSAKLGHTLHAGEGALLVEELERVTALVEAAYLEGCRDGSGPGQQPPDWYYSDARWLLTGEET